MGELVFRTSGSTGEPKTIVRSSAELDADAANLVRTFPFLSEGRPRYLATIRSEHFFGALWRDRVPVAAGCAVDGAVILTVEELVERSAAGGRYVLVTTPSFLETALGHPDFAGLRGRFAAVITSGSALRRATALAVAETLGVGPVEIYGSTEAGTIAWRRQTEGPLAHLVDGVEAEGDAEGRLVIRSPYAMTSPLVMSDLVRFETPRDFELLGRADRLVKILEKFVSLTAVERAFEAHEFIEAARAEAYGDGVQRVGLVAVPSAAGREALADGTFAGVVAVLRRAVAPVLGGAAFPRRIRFVRALPADGRGKTTAALVRGVLAAGCREPVVMRWCATARRLEAELVFPPDAEVFDGHFPVFRILPGVAQLYFLRHFARQVFPDFPDDGTFRKLKFRRMVRPGERLKLVCSDRFAFEFSVGGEIASSGILEGAGT